MNAARLIMRRGLRPAFMRVSDEMETTYFHKREGSQMILMFDGFEDLCELERREAVSIAGGLDGPPGGGAGPGMVGTEAVFDRLSLQQPSAVRYPDPGAPEDLGMHRFGGYVRLSGQGPAGAFRDHARDADVLGRPFFPLLPHRGDDLPHLRGRGEKRGGVRPGLQRGLAAGIELSHGLGGTINHHHGVGLHLGKYMHLELGEAGMENFRKIKQAMDPNDIMNPGKLGL